MKMSLKNSQFILLLGLTLLALIPLWVNGNKLIHQCINGYDFGIYYQVMAELDPPRILNPMLSVRGIPAFNDHFNPVLIPVSMLLKVGDLSPMKALFFEWFTWIIGLITLLVLLRPQGAQMMLKGALLFLLTKAFLTGLYFPIHVDFWSLPLWMILGWSLFSNRLGLATLIMIALGFFKESYPIAFLFTALVMLIQRQFLWGALLLMTSLAFTWWNLVLRPEYLGPIHGHGTNIFRMILTEPKEYFYAWWERFPFLGTIEVYFIPLWLLFASLGKDLRAGLLLASALAPLFGLHVLAGLMEFHYPFPFAAAGIGAAVACGYWSELFGNAHNGPWHTSKAARTFALILVCIPGASAHWSSLSLHWKKDQDCQFLPERRSEFQSLESALNSFEKETGKKPIIGASGGLIPNLIKPGRDLRQLLSHALIAPNYDILALETGDVGHPYPLNRERMKILVQACTPYLEQKLFSGVHLELWKGQFSADCIYQWPSPAVNAADFPNLIRTQQ